MHLASKTRRAYPFPALDRLPQSGHLLVSQFTRHCVGGKREVERLVLWVLEEPRIVQSGPEQMEFLFRLPADEVGHPPLQPGGLLVVGPGFWRHGTKIRCGAGSTWRKKVGRIYCGVKTEATQQTRSRFIYEGTHPFFLNELHLEIPSHPLALLPENVLHAPRCAYPPAPAPPLVCHPQRFLLDLEIHRYHIFTISSTLNR